MNMKPHMLGDPDTELPRTYYDGAQPWSAHWDERQGELVVQPFRPRAPRHPRCDDGAVRWPSTSTPTSVEHDPHCW